MRKLTSLRRRKIPNFGWAPSGRFFGSWWCFVTIEIPLGRVAEVAGPQFRTRRFHAFGRLGGKLPSPSALGPATRRSGPLCQGGRGARLSFATNLERIPTPSPIQVGGESRRLEPLGAPRAAAHVVDAPQDWMEDGQEVNGELTLRSDGTTLGPGRKKGTWTRTHPPGRSSSRRRLAVSNTPSVTTCRPRRPVSSRASCSSPRASLFEMPRAKSTSLRSVGPTARFCPSLFARPKVLTFQRA